MRTKNKALFASLTGNILEYYDFTVYSVFCLQIGDVFFPQLDEFARPLSSLTVFAAGFLTRPIGGIIFGYIGDKFGRRVALLLSIIGMTMPTIAIGLMPGYNSIGLLAPILLTLMRLMQGLCISGEGTGAAIFLLEHFHNFRPGFISSFVHSANIAGTLLAVSIGIIIENNMTSPEAWRYAFLLGGAFGVISLYLRMKVAETPIFREILKEKNRVVASVITVVKNNFKNSFIIFALGGLASSIVYFLKTYIHVFYNLQMGLSYLTSLKYLLYSSAVLMLGMPLCGFLSDIYGKKKVIFTTSFLILFFSYPCLYFMSSENMFLRFAALTILALMGSGISGVAYYFSVNLFPKEQRFTGVAFTYNLGIALFGGTSSMISKILIEYFDSKTAPALYLMGTSLFFIIIYSLFMKEKNDF